MMNNPHFGARELTAMTNARLTELFGGKDRFELLRILYLNPTRRFTNQELAQRANADAGNLHRLLTRWTKLGLVLKHVEGRNVLYQASADPLLEGLTYIVLRSDALFKDIQTALPDTVETAVIFGSTARGDERSGSDIDVLALGNNLSEIKVNAALKPVSRKHHRDIHVSVFSKEEFDELIRRRDGFVTSILQQRLIPLKGELVRGL